MGYHPFWVAKSKQSTTMATMEEMGVQNNDECPMNRRNPAVPTTLQWRMLW